MTATGHERNHSLKTHVKREPLFHVSKRDRIPLWKSITIRAVAILAALLLSGILTIFLTGENPLAVYKYYFVGAFGSSFKVWNTLQGTAILLGIALALTPAYKMRFWNTGAEGQVLIGCLATAFIMWKVGGTVPEPDKGHRSGYAGLEIYGEPLVASTNGAPLMRTVPALASMAVTPLMVPPVTVRLPPWGW